MNIYKNPSGQDIVAKIKEYAKKGPRRLLCFIHSHGNIEKYCGSDCGSVSIDETFAAANTDQMKEKPKCFFLSMCRKCDNCFII